jgi:drug/metabolite transporter (DMT)-like permease
MMVGATALFALMSAAVKAAALHYSAGEIVMVRSAIGLVLMAVVMRIRRIPLKSRVPQLHLTRSLSGTVALCLWFTAIAGLPLATAMTLNYMSSVWIALFLIGGAVLLAPERGGQPLDVRLDVRLVLAVLVGFAGVVLVLRPTIEEQQLVHGLVGLGSGLLAAVAYLQVTALGRLGEPGERVVFYFSLTGVVFGAAYALLSGGFSSHTLEGLLLLATIGVLATAAQWLMTRAYATGATLGIAALQYLAIVFSSLLGIWLFDEGLSASAWAGIALIIAAGVAATLLRDRPRPADSTLGDG